jgi:predicted ATP-grasp superfamily ATP-dependent carboligase
VERLGLSGFVGFDFMIHAGSGQAYLLEMNGRPTPICYLALDGPTDMISALAEPFAVTRRVPNIDSPIVALFPQENLARS